MTTISKLRALLDGEGGGFDLRHAPNAEANAALIVEAVNALPQLIAAAERVEVLEAELAKQPKWLTDPPEDGSIILVGQSMKFTPYKKGSRERQHRKGRWQESNGYGGWSNAAEPPKYWSLKRRRLNNAG